MRRIDALAIVALLLTPALFAQEHYSDGPVWRVSTVRVKRNRQFGSAAGNLPEIEVCDPQQKLAHGAWAGF